MTARRAALLLLLLAPACSKPGEAAREAADPDSLRGLVLPEPRALPSTAVLLDTEGAPYDLRARTEGRLALVFFGYTNCPDVCPVHLANVDAALERLGSATRRKVEVVFVTTDPGRDTPERIREWLDGFDRRFVGLRGNPDSVAAIQRGLLLPPSVVQPAPDGEGYLVGHAAQIIAFPADGSTVVYPFGTRTVDWVHDLPRLLARGAAPAGT